MSAKTTGTAKFTLDPKSPPSFSKRQKERLAALPDNEIDFSEIPSTHGVPWKRPGALASTENKQQVTLRIDADVLAFFRKTGRRYQTRMNAVLRTYMEAHSGARGRINSSR